MSFLKNIKTPDDLLQEYKEQKVATVNSIRDSKMLSFTYEGVEYQTRPTDRENILGQALEISLGNENDVLWITADNTITTFTAQEFVVFAKAVSDQKRQCVFNARQMKDAILAATSKEEVDAVEWNDEA